MLTTSKSEERRFSVGLRPAASIRYDKEDVDCDYAFKAVLVGESFVGKTSLLLRFMSGDLYGERPPRPPPTLGLSSRTEKLNLRGLNVKVSIWDTAGQERGVEVAFVVFDVNSRQSFGKVSLWLEPIKSDAVENAVVMLIGNKIDGPRKVTTEEALKFAREHGILYAETSAATGIGVDGAFLGAFEELLKRVLDEKSIHSEKRVKGGNREGFVAQKPQEVPQQPCCS